MKRTATLGGILVVAVTLAAQTPKQTTPTFRTAVDYVRVDVVVTGRDDRPITDLKASEFEVREDGQPQEVADFTYIDIPVVHRDLPPADQPLPPPSDIVSNPVPAPNGRVFVIVVDDQHLIEADIIPVKRVMTDLIRALSADDDVAIVFVGRSDLSQNFTRDPVRLLKAVENVRAAMGFGMDAMGQDPTQRAHGEEMLAHGRTTTSDLSSVAATLAQSSHARRAIVLISGFSVLSPEFDPCKTPCAPRLMDMMRDVFEAARKTNVPIYTIDPRGVPSPETAVRGWGATSETERAVIAKNIIEQQDRLSEFAINTGGRAFINRSNLAGAVDELVRDNGSFYQLGYYPNPPRHDGKFHQIRVAVTRPGAHVRARQGYVAASATTPAAGLREALDLAMGSGLNVSGIALRVFAAPLAPSAKGTSAVVTVEVSYPVPADGSLRIDDDLGLNVLALDSDGKIKGSWSRPWQVAGTAPPMGGQVTFLIDDVIDLPPQTHTLRVGVASQALGKAGTVQVPIDVPNLKDGGLQMSGLVLGVGDPSTTMATIGADAIKGLVPFQPALARTFAASDTVRVFGRLFWGGKDPSPTVTITVRGAATPITTTALVKDVASAGRRQGSFDATVTLQGLAAGDYVLDVVATLPGGAHIARAIPIAVR